jgi:DNA-binding response OmpR family regulator
MQKCILIYDDEPDILNVCKAILEKEDYRIETLSYCENVIEDISSMQPDLILMDLWIPKIGGEKAIQMMRGNTVTKNIPVILFSANDDIEKICEGINASAFLKKPFEISDFKKIIAEWI